MKTNVSEIDIVAGTDGSLTVAEPLISVSTASTTQLQPIGCEYKVTTDWTIAQIPSNATVQT